VRLGVNRWENILRVWANILRIVELQLRSIMQAAAAVAAAAAAAAACCLTNLMYTRAHVSARIIHLYGVIH